MMYHLGWMVSLTYKTVCRIGTFHAFLSLARLDKFYVGQWGQAIGGQVGIWPSHISHHDPILLQVPHTSRIGNLGLVRVRAFLTQDMKFML